MGCRDYPSWSTSSPSFSFTSDLSVPSVVSVSFCSLLLSLASVFFSFLDMFVEVPLTWLMGSALTCSGSIAEPSGTLCVQHRAAPISSYRGCRCSLPTTKILLHTPGTGFQIHTGKLDRECDQAICTTISFCWSLGIFYFTQRSFYYILCLFIQRHTFNIMLRSGTHLWSHTTFYFERILFINAKNKFRNF